MQTLARDGLTAEQVTALLKAESLQVSAGCDLLNADLTFRQDISNDLLAGKVSRNNNAAVHGTCQLLLSRQLAWGVDLVRPYMLLTAGGVTARFNVGVFTLTTPERRAGESVPTFDVQGYDRVQLLQRQIGASYTIAAGTTYRTAILNTFTAAGLTGVVIEGAAADDVLPTAASYPLVGQSTSPDQTTTPVTWLRVVNDLLRAINFRAVWANEDGVFVCQQYQQPSARPVEFAFDADEVLTVVGEDRVEIADVWATPNRWVFRQTNRPSGAPVATEGDGLYTVDLSNTTSGDFLGRRLVWASVVDYEAASQAKLVALGQRRVQIDRSVTVQLKVTTGPFPCAGHFDVYTFADAALGLPRKVQSVGFTFDLSGSDVQHDWEVV